MPAEGFKTITVPDETLNRLKKGAEKTHRSVPQYIKYLIEKHGRASQ